MIVSSFDSQDLILFTTVLERACCDLGTIDESRRQAIAARIVHMAQTGERDFEILRKYATGSNLRDRREFPRLDHIVLMPGFSVIGAVH